MDAEEIQRWRIADQLFSAWLDQHADDRDAWLASQSLAAGIERALKKLIALHQATTTDLLPLDQAAIAQPQAEFAHNRLAGRRVGHWLLIEEIGRGGMSVVYKAQRLDVDFEQLAAVKLLSMAALGAGGGARFEQERRLLARLRHPHIASLIDGGFADDGTPFLAMTLIDGQSLAKYCENRRLDWREGARLLIKICGAVAHAHQNLMVHRDLKPANIMLTEQGEPVLLDFGIAKLLDSSQQDTRTGVRAMTPGYAAPEQIIGGQITTATDVYALGVILRGLCGDHQALPQDLRNIIAMAMREDAARRYPDARALGEDLERLLEQRAVQATPDSRSYRLRAFMRRRRGLVVATGLVAMSLLIGLGVSMWQAQRASRQAEEALRQASRATAARDFLLDMIAAGDREHSEAVDPPVSTVIARGIATLQDAPLVDSELHAEMAMLLGQIDASIGQHQRAGELLNSALESAERVGDPALIAQIKAHQGVLANNQGEPERAITLFNAALDTANTLDGNRREVLLTSSLSGWAYAMSNVGRGAEAKTQISDTLNTPDLIRSAERRDELLLAQSTVTDDPQEKLDLLLHVEKSYTTLTPSPADQLTLASMLGISYGQLGNRDAAVLQLQKAAKLTDRIHPGNSSRRARAYNNLGSTLASVNRMGEADAALAIAEGIYRALGDQGSPAFAALLHNRGTLLRDLGIAEAAVPLIAQAHEMARQQFGEGDRRTVMALRNLAFARAEDHADPRADADWREAQRHASNSWPAQDHYTLNLIGAAIAASLGDARLAAQRLAKADAVLSPESPDLLATLLIRRSSIAGQIRSLDAKPADATALFEQAAALAEATGTAAWSANWRNHLAFAEHLSRNGNTAGARDQFSVTLKLLEERGNGLDSKLRQRLREQISASAEPYSP